MTPFWIVQFPVPPAGSCQPVRSLPLNSDTNASSGWVFVAGSRSWTNCLLSALGGLSGFLSRLASSLVSSIDWLEVLLGGAASDPFFATWTVWLPVSGSALFINLGQK